MAAAHKQFVRGLVDRSHERMVQARAGQSLQQILSDDESAADGRLASLPQLPPHLTTSTVAPALVYNARANERRAHKAEADNSSEPLPKPRRQGVLAVSASVDTLDRPRGGGDSGLRQHHHTSSQEQFLEYIHQKNYRSGALRPNDRRRGVLPQAKELRKLVAAATAEQQEAHESAKAKLARALAKIRGHGAFLQARGLQPAPTPSFGDIKNAHLAFLEFRRQGAGGISSQRRRVHPSAGLEDGNTTTKIPIRFGDQICLLSTVSHLPLAVGTDGRSRSAESTAVGPHMTLTIVDFCNPLRRDELTLNDAFWLRIDASALQDGADNSHHDGDEGDDLESLLVDTSYFLGCPGWLDTECTAQAAHSKRRRRGRGGNERPKLFRLVAMKALTPSRDYYGDDAATREFAMETNEHIVRLAWWQFALQQSKQQQALPPDRSANPFEASPGDVNDALLNCSLVQLSQDHNFVLSYGGSQLRGVEGDEDNPSVKWLREKQALVARNGGKLLGKMGLAQLARQQFERVAAESNSKLAQIEQHKAQRAPAYFEQLLHAVAASPPSVSPPKKTAHDGHQEPTRLPTLNQHRLPRAAAEFRETKRDIWSERFVNAYLL